jgi:hypothetical protein
MELRESTDKSCEDSMMIRCLGLLVLAAAALAEDRPVSDLQILKWQVEAQARERSLARRLDLPRRLDLQGETAPTDCVQSTPEPTRLNSSGFLVGQSRQKTPGSQLTRTEHSTEVTGTLSGI